MKKTIYVAIDIPRNIDGDEFYGKFTYDKAEAIADAENQLAHLTKNERENRIIYVGVFEQEVNDGETAQEAFERLTYDDEWIDDHNMIEIEEN